MLGLCIQLWRELREVAVKEQIDKQNFWTKHQQTTPLSDGF
jgi:hypothetical protein